MKINNNEVSFITINYNSSIHTIELIKSIIAHTRHIKYEIIVVDNNSKNDDFNTLNKFIQNLGNIKLIRNDINCGFSCANVLERKHANGKYPFSVNNDTKLLNNTYLLSKHFGFFSQKILLLQILLKLFRRSCKRKNGWHLFLFGLSGFPKKNRKKYYDCF